MSLFDIGGPTPAEQARNAGNLVYDECSGEFVEIEPLSCQHSTVRIGPDGTITCAECGDSR